MWDLLSSLFGGGGASGGNAAGGAAGGNAVSGASGGGAGGNGATVGAAGGDLQKKLEGIVNPYQAKAQQLQEQLLGSILSAPTSAGLNQTLASGGAPGGNDSQWGGLLQALRSGKEDMATANTVREKVLGDLYGSNVLNRMR
jgi:hypothetical protein